jgi:acyl dehydratase
MKTMFDVGSTAEMLAAPVGAYGLSDWKVIDQQLIDDFAKTTGDHQWIHVDVARAEREMPGGRTIAHGYLSLSLTPQLLEQTWLVRNERRSLNYGLEGVRFVSPLASGSRIRLRAEVKAVEPWREEGAKLTLGCTIEVEGGERPVAVFTQLALFEFD